MTPNVFTDTVGLIILMVLAAGLIGLSFFGCLLGALSDFSTGRNRRKKTPPPTSVNHLYDTV